MANKYVVTSANANATRLGIFTCGIKINLSDVQYLEGSGGNSPLQQHCLLPMVYLDPNTKLKNIGTKNNCNKWQLSQ